MPDPKHATEYVVRYTLGGEYQCNVYVPQGKDPREYIEKAIDSGDVHLFYDLSSSTKIVSIKLSVNQKAGK